MEISTIEKEDIGIYTLELRALIGDQVVNSERSFQLEVLEAINNEPVWEKEV
jgi:hypothetical protein